MVNGLMHLMCWRKVNKVPEMRKVENFKTSIGNISFEMFKSCNEFVDVCRNRDITDSRFRNERLKANPGFTGVESFEEALRYLSKGYEPTVKNLERELKSLDTAKVLNTKRFTDYVGYRPNVPNAILGLPKAMYNTRTIATKGKIINLVYDMTCSYNTSSEDILSSGAKAIAIVKRLEGQGYRVNLYSAQSYAGSNDCDMVLVSIKGASEPFNLKRMSFPLTHTGFFRCLGFDWYSRCPGAKYRGGYGHALRYSHDVNKIESAYSKILNEKCLYINCVDLLKETPEHYVDAYVNKQKG